MPRTRENLANVLEMLQRSATARRGALIAALLLLSLITGFSQIKTEGLAWQETHYLPRLEAVVSGSAPAPGQYRILTDGLVVAACRGAGALGVPRSIGTTFVALRLLQNIALFLLAYLYFRRLGIGAYAAVLGLSALAWGMTQANYGSDLGFNAYTDILFYLCAALVLLEKRYRWLYPIAIAAALNRETSGLLPVMALACAISPRPRLALDRAIARPALVSLCLYGLVFVLLRAAFGWREWAGLEAGASPGPDFLLYNLRNDAAWGHAFGVLGIMPVLALLSYRSWRPILRPFFWSVVPAWFLLHLLLAPLDESRVLLLPQILVFIPGMLCGLQDVCARDATSPRGLLA